MDQTMAGTGGAGKRRIFLVTSDPGKVQAARSVLGDSCEVEGLRFQLPELQGTDARGIVEEKLVEAMKRTGKDELMVEDSSLRMKAMNNLPGPMVKWFIQSIGAEGLYNMAESRKSYDAKAVSVVGYLRKPGRRGAPYEIHIFEGEAVGWIVPPRGENGMGWDPIFMPAGAIKTFAEMKEDDKMRVSHRAKAFEAMKRFLESEAAGTLDKRLVAKAQRVQRPPGMLDVFR